MSDFFIRQNLLSSNARTIIKNEAGEPVFLMVGRWGTRGDVLSLYQMNGEIVASIKQATFAMPIGARFDLYQEFEKVGSLQRILSIHRDFYYVHQLGWVVIGDIKNQDYHIYQLNRKVMTLKKKTLTDGEFHHFVVFDDADAPLCICIAAVLDYWLLNRHKQGLEFKKLFPELDY
ncbi:LURP-one-related/scramblase family protein [Vagococcus salmoninarum]|uniref:Tubby C 2 family protein n=1 Tax=Vagococcus salmoninarum TaxID=2739 RepID=A0A429ZCH6_9ENTE|nr:hypothetical protein [Vagococcus salmoninarum]RST91380.1 hypothetical protein CBF35_14310 [Vagococcus salmoninarum]